MLAVSQAIIATGALNCALEGRIFQRISVIERIILAIAALGLLYWDVRIEMVSLAVIVALAAWSGWRAAAARRSLVN